MPRSTRLFDAPAAQLGGPNLIYANVAAFSGVLGKAVMVKATQEGLDALVSTPRSPAAPRGCVTRVCQATRR